MKAIKYIIICLAALLTPVLISCAPEEPTIDFSDSTTFAAPADGGSQSVSFITNYNWEASASDPWIQVSPASGKKGNASVTIKVIANDTGKARKGGVTITSQSLTKSITVNQAANLNQTLVIKHSNSTFAVPAITGSVTGKVSWGDGSEENYSSNLKHSYSSGSSHTVTVKLNGGTGFDLSSLAGVTEIDVTEF